MEPSSAEDPQKEALARRQSTSSSQGSSVGSDWTVLNAQGSEIESSSVQTEKREKEKMESSASSSVESDFVEVSPLHSDAEAEQAGSLLVSFLKSSSLVASKPALSPQESLGSSEDRASEPSCSHHSQPNLSFSKADTKTISSDESSGSEDEVTLGREKEFLEGALREHPVLRQGYSLDSQKVAQLLDALANAVDSHHSEYNEDLPVNFVQMCSNRIKNYMHTKNGNFNWKLSLLLTLCIALVLGLGLGHFIGTTHAWLKRHRVAKQQVEQLKTLQDGLVTCLGKLETVDDKLENEILGLKQQLSACRSLSGHCDANDKPSCHNQQNVLETDLDTCKMQLNHCQTEMEEIEEGLSRKAVSNRWALSRLAQLQRDAALREDANTGWVKARSRQRIAEKNQSFLRERILRMGSEATKNKKELVKTVEDQEDEIDELVHAVADREKKIEELNVLIEEYKQREKQLSSPVSTATQNEVPCADKGEKRSFPDSGPSASIASQSLRDALYSGNLTSVIQSYVAYMKSIDFDGIASDTSQVISTQLNQLGQMVHYLKGRLDSELRQGRENWSEGMTSQMETALSEVWDFTRNTAHWASQNGPKEVEKLMNMLSSDVIKGFDHVKSAIGGKDPVDILHMVLRGDFKPVDPAQEEPERQVTRSPIHEDGVLETSRSGEEINWKVDTVPKTAPANPTEDLPLEMSDNEASDIYELRDALKRSSLQEELEWDEYQYYMAELKRMGKVLRRNHVNEDEEILTAWMCQKNWWNQSPQSHCNLYEWQDYRGSDQIDEFLETNPTLLEIIESWSSEPFQTDIDYDDDDDEDDEEHERNKYIDGTWDWKRGKDRAGLREKEAKSDWLFDRYRDRERMRKEEKKAYESTEWMFRRGKKRRSEWKSQGRQDTHKKSRKANSNRRKVSRDEVKHCNL